MLPVIVFAVAITSSGITTGPNDPILVPDATLNRGGFYKKLVYMRGLPIVASEKVDDRALRTIVSTFTKMLAKVPDAPIELLVKQGSFYSIIGATEGQTDLPEYAYLRNDPNMDWNKRARGLGGLSASGGEENILELPNDRYHGESIYIHEFAHTLFDYGFSKVDSSLVSKLQKCFDSAIKAGKWKDTYAATNPSEYWAEGVQDYFDCNRSAVPANKIHNEICTREQLKEYDRDLYKLIDRLFGGVKWRYEGKYHSVKPVVPKTNS